MYYLLPGGGQEFGETLHDTLQRECSEEVGCEIRIGELLFVREYRGWLHEFATAAQDEHTLEFMFACSVEGNFDHARASQPDKGQIGVEWLALEELAALLASTATVAASPTGEAAPAQERDPDYARLLDALGWDTVDTDTLALRSGLTPAEVSSMLLILELEGSVQPLPGGRYQRQR